MTQVSDPDSRGTPISASQRSKLLKSCQEILAKAQKRIELLTGVEEGKETTEPFEAADDDFARLAGALAPAA